MNKPIEELINANKFKSIEAIARALIERLPDNLRRGLQPRSLSTRVGQIDRGEVSWWKKRPELADHLSDLLVVDLEDLGIHKTDVVGTFEFKDFPALPPVNLQKENLFSLGSAYGVFKKSHKIGEGYFAINESRAIDLDVWLKSTSTFRGPYEVAWIHVSDSLLLNLIYAWLSVKSKFSIHRIYDLSQLSDYQSQYSPKIFFVDQINHMEELQNIKYLQNQFGTLIFSLSPTESYKKTDDEEDVIKIKDLSEQQIAINIYKWKLPINWKTEIIHWVDKRFTNRGVFTLLDLETILQWVESFDKDDLWFTSISDILNICNIAHKTYKKDFPKIENAKAGEVLCSFAFNGKDSHLESFKKLTYNLWHLDEYDWGDSFNEAVIKSINSILDMDADEIIRQLEELTSEIHKRSLIEKLRKQKTIEISSLIENKLIKKIKPDLFQAEHQFLMNLLVRDIIQDSLKVNLMDSFWIFFDESRVSLAKSSLGMMKLEDLLKITDQATMCYQENKSSAGLLECLFIELSKKIPIEFSELNKEQSVVVRRLFNCFKWFDEDGLINWGPNKLNYLVEGHLDEWDAACFSWSMIENNAYLAKDHAAFPGWIKNYDAEYYSYLHPNYEKINNLNDLPFNCRQLIKVATSIASKQSLPIKGVSPLLHFSYLINAAKGMYEFNQDWWATVDIIPSNWKSNYFESLVIDNELSVDAILRLISSYSLYLKPKKDDKLTYFKYTRSPILACLISRLESQDNFSLIPNNLFYWIAKILIEREHKSKLLDYIFIHHFKNENLRIAEVDELINWFGIKISHCLPEILDYHFANEDDSENLHSPISSFFWKWCPEEAKTLLFEDYKGLKLQALRSLIWECPTKYTTKAINIIKNHESLIFNQVEMNLWVSIRLTNTKKAVIDFV